MATFETQIEMLTSLTIDDSSSPTRSELSQFLTDGAKEVINHLPNDLLKLCSTVTTLTGGTSHTMNTGKILSVKRSDGYIYHPSREIPSRLSGRVTDPDDMLFATINDPVYYKESNSLHSLPEGNPWQYEEVQFPTIAYGDTAIDVFPDEAEYIVVLYAAIKALQNALGSRVSNSDIATALTAINTELDETQAICDLINTQVDAAVTQLGESVTQVDADVDTALTAINTASDRINTAVALANTQFDSAVTSNTAEDVELASSQINAGNGFISEARASANEAQSFVSEVSARMSQVSGYNTVVSGYINAAQGYATEIQNKIAIAQGYSNEVQSRLSAITTDFSFIEKQQVKLQSDYEKALQALKS